MLKADLVHSRQLMLLHCWAVVQLLCRVGCSGDIGAMTYFCTDFSESENWSAGERTVILSYIYDFSTAVPSFFEASYVYMHVCVHA